MMMYPVDPHHVIVQPIEQQSSRLKLIICVAICISLIVSAIIIGASLGVGLGLGLRKRSIENQILVPLNIDCHYINSSVCGCAPTKPLLSSLRIINGNTAIAHSWPWTVALYLNNHLLCEGFLVSDQHVITAAHCIIKSSSTSFQIRAGVHLRSSLNNIQIRNVSSIRKHPEFSSTTLLNDIAILKLTTKITPTNTVGRCCLPTDSSLPIVGESAVIVGWGRMRTADRNSLSDTLQQTVVQIRQCPTDKNFNEQFCAGYKSNDACQGDSGGPLMTNVNNQWTCTGIVSYGVGCGNGGYYTRVAYYRSFIDKAILSM